MNHHTHPVPGAGIQMQLLTEPGDLAAEKVQQLLFKPVRRTNPGATVTLARQHEALFHLIVLDESLNWFRHLHPELRPDGSYQVNIAFPAGGNYLLYADYQPEGGPALVDKMQLRVAGNPQHAAVGTSEKLTAITGNLSVALDLTTPLHTGTASLLPFRIDREGTPLKATALSPYLGAIAHLILIHQADKDFLHIHPEAGSEVPVIAHTLFKKPGTYRMWIQFNTDEILHTADFAFDVKAGPASPTLHHHGHH